MKVYNYTGFFIVLSGVNLKGEKIEIRMKPYGNAEFPEPAHLNIDSILTEVT